MVMRGGADRKKESLAVGIRGLGASSKIIRLKMAKSYYSSFEALFEARRFRNTNGHFMNKRPSSCARRCFKARYPYQILKSRDVLFLLAAVVAGKPYQTANMANSRSS